MAGFACIEFLFKWVNWKEGRFAQHEGAFSVLGLPLYGSAILWDVALRAADEQVRWRRPHASVWLSGGGWDQLRSDGSELYTREWCETIPPQ